MKPLNIKPLLLSITPSQDIPVVKRIIHFKILLRWCKQSTILLVLNIRIGGLLMLVILLIKLLLEDVFDWDVDEVLLHIFQLALKGAGLILETHVNQ